MLQIVKSEADDTPPPRRTNRVWAFVAIVFFHGPAMFGAFAITPIVNYLLAGCGFLLLFAWAARNGMFRDIEAPKFQMLENERRLDASQNIGNGAPAV